MKLYVYVQCNSHRLRLLASGLFVSQACGDLFKRRAAGQICIVDTSHYILFEFNIHFYSCSNVGEAGEVFRLLRKD